MKAVIIAESQNIIDEFSQYYKSNGFDVIVYRWLMKAMDNIEEIDPDLIFINAEEYNVGHMTVEETKPWLATMKKAKAALVEKGISVSLNPWIEFGVPILLKNSG